MLGGVAVFNQRGTSVTQGMLVGVAVSYERGTPVTQGMLGGVLDDDYANFNSFGRGFLTLFQVFPAHNLRLLGYSVIYYSG